MAKKLVVLVHGWSVSSTETYGRLADRLEAEAGEWVDVRNLWLSKYVSFDDDVRVEDLSRAFEAAVRRELGAEIDAGKKLVCITHSTGGPVIRDWWDRFYRTVSRSGPCPMSHLVMLAPPNFGSALAQLGKGKLGRIKTWFQGVEPGQKVLDWLELGSAEAWDLNQRWIESDDPATGRNPVYQFSLIGQSIDRKLYDHLNSYTGELGSDGVVRAAAANLNATYIRLEQQEPVLKQDGPNPVYEAPELKARQPRRAPRTAFALVPGMAHSGKEMGILRSIGADPARPHPAVEAILACIRVDSPADYQRVCDEFDARTQAVMAQELVEKEERLLPDRWFIHDPCSMVIFRVVDHRGYPLEAFDLKLIAGETGDPNLLPEGFARDRQANQLRRSHLTYFLNAAKMLGCPAVTNPDKPAEVLRKQVDGAEKLGLEMVPHQQEGLVHFLPARLQASVRTLNGVVKPHETTLVEIVMQRVVHQRAYELTQDRGARDFRRGPNGPAID